jgi:hypothetical protein
MPLGSHKDGIKGWTKKNPPEGSRRVKKLVRKRRTIF